MTIPLIGIDMGGAYTGVIHQDRLVLMGSDAVSDLVMASKIGGERTDFRLGTITGGAGITEGENDGLTDDSGAQLDDDGFAVTFETSPSDGFWLQQTSSRSNTFHAAIQQEGIFIFGDLGESSIPAAEEFTADDVKLRENSWYGTETGRTVLIVGGLVVFIQKGGQDIRGVNWSEQDRKYVAPSLLTLSGNLFDRAVDMSFAPSKDRRSDTVYVVGESDNPELDGQLATMLIRHQEPFYAWSRWQTAGRIVGGAAPLGNRCFLVERGGNPAMGIDGTVALETIAPDNTDSLDATVDLTAVLAQADDGLPYVRYGDLPDHAAWMEGLTNLDGLELWHIDKTGNTVTAHTAPAVLPGDGIYLRVRSSTVEAWTEESGWQRAPIPGRAQGQAVDPAPGNPLPDPAPFTGVVGLGYTRSVDTLPFVARKQTGTSTRLRPTRIMEVNVDLILPEGYVHDGSSPRPRSPRELEQELRLGQMTVSAVTANRGRGRARRISRSPRITHLDTPRLVRVRYGGRAGWRDRVALRVESTRHVVLAGIAYRVVG